MAQRALGQALRLALTLTLGTLLACGDETIERVMILPGAGGADDSGTDEHGTSPLDSGRPPSDAEVDAKTDAEDDGGPEPCADDATCQPVCGDGVREADEECDDGDIEPGDGCDELCRAEPCPDGGARKPDGSCRPSSTGPECGNGVIEGAGGEECEPALALEGTCDAATCTRLPACGDGEIEPSAGEECDPSDGIHCVNCRIVEPIDPDGGVDEEAPCVPLPVPVVGVTNGTFDADASGWTPRTRITTTRSTEGAAQAGSLAMIFEPLAGGDAGYEISGAFQCVFVPPGAEYLLKVQYQVPASVAAEVSPMLILRSYENADCTGASATVGGPALGNVRGAWTAREGTISVGPEARALLVQLAIVKPRNVEGAVLWDDIVLESDQNGARCGNCEVDDEQGEGCDDGNRTDGDGCSADCQIEGCGDGVVNAFEDCDDGAHLFGDDADTCTPACRTKDACDSCAAASCSLELGSCMNLTGDANAGPRAGSARAELCDELRACVHATGCAGDTAISTRSGFGTGRFLEHCYCGTAGQGCFDGDADGSCRAEVEAALETTDPVAILSRVGGAVAQYPLFAALNELLECEAARCATSCQVAPSCGDGIVQDRSADFAATFKFRIGTMQVACDDALTHTGTGCSFEECDDGNTEGGDGCDESCFVEACGNNLKQGDEECDDGNLVSGDGCDQHCVAEFECGDGTVEEPFEECDPPGMGPVCTEAQYEANAAQCGCDESCARKVCGNGVVQEGEECDPPGPACSEACELLEDECTSCVRRIDGDAGATCGGRAWLEGQPGLPGFELGCLNDQACFELWNCNRASLCPLSPFGYHACYCGEVAPDVCEAASYRAAGPCKDELLAAYEAQLGYTPLNNSEIINNLYPLEAPAGAYASLFVAWDLSANCLVPDGASGGGGMTLRGNLLVSGVSESEADACVDACFEGLP